MHSRVSFDRVRFLYVCRETINMVDILQTTFDMQFMQKNYILIVITMKFVPDVPIDHKDGLVQERRNAIDNAQELRLSRTNPSN